MSDERALSEMTFTEAFDVERAQCKSSEAAMGRLAGRYAAGYAYEYDRAAALEAELATAQKIIEAREAQIAHLQAPADRPLAEQVRQEAMGAVDGGPMVPRAALEWLAGKRGWMGCPGEWDCEAWCDERCGSSDEEVAACWVRSALKAAKEANADK